MRYEAPESIEAAVGLLMAEDGTAKILAGGTDLLVQLRAGALEPALVVDIKRIAETTSIVEEDGAFRIGAAVPAAEVGEHAGLRRAWPGVCEAMGLIGSTQIQGRASAGGNLCNASPAADAVPALTAARAIARIAGPDGVREVPVHEVPQGPGRTALAKGEFVTSILLPAPAPGQGDAYRRFIPRTEMDIAVVGCGVWLTLDGERCSGFRIALGAVGPRVVVVEGAGPLMRGTTLDGDALGRLEEAVRGAVTPIDDKRGTADFRRQVAGVLARRAALAAQSRARETA